MPSFPITGRATALRLEPQVFTRLLSQRALSFYWDDPASDTLVAGHGQAHVLESRSASARFDLVDDAAEALDALRWTQGSERAPLFFGGGFAFDPTRHRPRGWSGFPAGRLVLPRLSLVRRGADCWAVGVDLPLQQLQRMVTPLADPQTLNAAAPSQTPRPLTRKAAWNKAIRQILAAIDAGAVQKVVLARQLSVSLDGPLPLLPLLTRLRALQPDCTVFAIARDRTTFVGATPELLFRRVDRALESVALAGSTRRDPDAKTDRALAASLRANPKERSEHAFVKDAVLDALSRFGEATSGPLRIRKLRNVQHLETPLRATLREGVAHAALLDALHPTPAVCGTPRDPARTLLRELEGFDRGWYAGPVGIIGAGGEAHFAVAIRSMRLGPSEATLFAGAGIVEGSVAENEWRETELKSWAMLAALR